MTDKILVVEDELNIAQIIKKYLEQKGNYQVLTAINGKEGYELAIKEKPFLIISDSMMPIMDGLELCDKVKGDKSLEGTLFLMLTGKTQQEDIIEGLNTGADGYMTKPFDIKEVMARVKAFEKIYKLQNRLKDELRERKKLEHELLKREKAKGALEMAGATAHELNQPLQAILSFSNLLESHDNSPEEVMVIASHLKSLIKQIRDITNKINNITKYETTEYVGETTIIDINKASS